MYSLCILNKVNQGEIKICDGPLWAEGVPGKISQINPFPHDFHGLLKGVAMSGITDMKNFITADQLSIPKKHYTSQSWRTNTLLLKVSHTSSTSKSDANIFHDNFWSQGK